MIDYHNVNVLIVNLCIFYAAKYGIFYETAKFFCGNFLKIFALIGVRAARPLKKNRVAARPQKWIAARPLKYFALFIERCYICRA